MAKKKKQGKYFTAKNYIWLIVISILIILLAIYCIDWYKVKRKDKLMNSYLITTNTLTYEIKDLSEVEQVLKESPSEYFIFISYNNNEKNYRLEKKLKRYIDEYGLKDEMYYINITDEIEKDNIYEELNETFNTKAIVNTPCILYYKDNLLERVIINENGTFNHNDFAKLLEEYDYQK